MECSPRPSSEPYIQNSWSVLVAFQGTSGEWEWTILSGAVMEEDNNTY